MKTSRLTTLLVSLMALAGLAGCQSFGARSTGAALPQAESTFDDGELKVTIEHDCSGTRCSQFSAKFTNLSDNPIEIVHAQSTISRAGESFALERVGDVTSNLVVPARAQAEVDYRPVDKKGMPLTYVKAEAVWCSLQVDKECQNPARGEALCAGFARYYHQAYLSAGGWLSLRFTYKTPWRTTSLTSLVPQFFAEPPPVALSKDTDAPWWYSSGGSSVFMRVTCDDKCSCREVDKRRNFFVDDKFAPVLE